MFWRMRRCGKIRNVTFRKKGMESDEFTTIIREKGAYFGVENIFDKSFVADKGFFDM